MNNPQNKDLHFLREDEAAKFLGLSKRTLQAWRFFRKGPAFFVISRRAVRYRIGDLVAWQNSLQKELADAAAPASVAGAPVAGAAVTEAPAQPVKRGRPRKNLNTAASDGCNNATNPR